MDEHNTAEESAEDAVQDDAAEATESLTDTLPDAEAEDAPVDSPAMDSSVEDGPVEDADTAEEDAPAYDTPLEEEIPEEMETETLMDEPADLSQTQALTEVPKDDFMVSLSHLGSNTIYLMGLSFILGSLFTILILILLDFMRRNQTK